MTWKILAVDDDPDILEAIRLILESRSYEVIGARNGLQALEKMKIEKPDLMILDLLMPEMDGFDVCKALSSPPWSDEYGEMPVLILTSVREEASRRRFQLETGKELGADDYLEKPFMPDILLEKIEKLIGEKP